MEISGAASTAATASTTVAIEVQKKAQTVQAEAAATLIESLPDPTSPKGQNINVSV